jgi:hypothetical protein
MLIGLVARVLKGHVEVTKVRIDVHGKDVSKEVTQERGEVVLNALVRNGIDAGGSRSRGSGRARTASSSSSKAGPSRGATLRPSRRPSADGVSGAPSPPTEAAAPNAGRRFTTPSDEPAQAAPDEEAR